MSEQTKLVPAAEAEAICRRYYKSMVIILAFDPITRRIEATTYGTSPASQSAAVATASVVAQALGFKDKEAS
jgi:hypothetical protein